MKLIYTKTGDTGKTTLIGQNDISKDDIRIKTCGEIDELNSALGVTRAYINQEKGQYILKFEPTILSIQKELFQLGFFVASLFDGSDAKSNHDFQPSIIDFENMINELSKDLPVLDDFIVPGGNLTSAHLHLACSVCRRAERSLVSCLNSFPEQDKNSYCIFK